MRVTKRELFLIFWRAWSSTMKTETIMKKFQAIGVLSMDAEVVLKRFNNHTSEQDTDTEIEGHGYEDS
jgi:hypothetical protein